MWDERYSDNEYVYGTKPNGFLKQWFTLLPKGKILSLAEGEGRNAVFLAQQGYDVTAVDASMVGLEKAQNLAKEAGVTINTVHADLAEFSLDESQWDGVISIFCALPSGIRKSVHARVQRGLKPGGVFMLEAYTPEQINMGTGGGNDVDMMQTAGSLREELPDLSFEHLNELKRSVVEGKFHTGDACVVQAIAKRR